MPKDKLHYFISIEAENEAFDTLPKARVEIARILRKLADEVELYKAPMDGDRINLRDINGNTVGKAWAT